VIEGTVLSMGQVYAIQGLATSIFMWIALALYSPLLAILSAVGAILGSFLPLTFLEPGSYESVYSGLWGYNCILSVAAVSWACFTFSWLVLIFICGPKFIWPTSDSGNHCLLVLPMELQLFLCKSP
jgi:urea transporter